MKETILGLLLFSFFSCLSCSSERVAEDPLMKEGAPMLFDVKEVEDVASRGLINQKEQLQLACSPAGGQQSIGLWADRMENGLTEFNILGNNTSLIYNKRQGGNPYNAWNYEGDVKRWKDPDRGVYKFRAYFPQSIDVAADASNATNFVASYNTATMQEDLLVAYKEVDAASFDLYTPVPLRFKHGLAALRFQLKFKEGYEEKDALTELWLQNDLSQDFSYIGTMVFGLQEDVEGIRWTESAQMQYYKKMYYWHNPEGVTFENARGKQTMAVAYTLPESTSEGQVYARNDGWLLVIPQHSPGTVTMNFTTKKGGSEGVYSIPLPKVTGTDLSGARRPDGEYFVPGFRYTYTFTLTKTHADVTLSVAPWNRLESSLDVPY